jgi:hypothetical protein
LTFHRITRLYDRQEEEELTNFPSLTSGTYSNNRSDLSVASVLFSNISMDTWQRSDISRFVIFVRFVLHTISVVSAVMLLVQTDRSISVSVQKMYAET